jgi:hypothetical protein
MAYKLSIQHKGQYLHLTVSGVTNLQNILAVWKKLAQVSKRLHITKILSEGCLEIPGYGENLHDYAKRISDTEIPTGTKIALICSTDRFEELSRSGSVLTTRFSVFPRVFTSVEEGIKWLTR